MRHMVSTVRVLTPTLPLGTVLALAWALALVPAPATAAAPESGPASIGFANPDDIDALLAYRLPDWGYRTLDLSLDLNGQGSDYTDHYGRASFGEALALGWYRESEQRVWQISALHGGRWAWGQLEGDDGKTVTHSLGGTLNASGSVRRYLNDRWALLGQASLASRYNDSGRRAHGTRVLRVDRQFDGGARAGLGWGRLRDVAPLLQARRLDERLRALGRPSLTPAQVQALARTLAQRRAYNVVYDRADRRFWQDVLAPLLSSDRPLTPYEVLYLADVEAERLGTRRQGWQVDLTGGAGYEAATGEGPRTTAGPELDAVWSVNPDLDHQLSLSLDGWFDWHDQDLGTQEEGAATLGFTHLWVVADRTHWSNRLSGSFEYNKSRESSYDMLRRNYRLGVSSQCDIYVEDRVALTPRLEVGYVYSLLDPAGRNGWVPYPSRRVAEGMDWSVQVAVSYVLDNTLF